MKKSERDEIFEQIADIDGRLRALQTLVLRHIFETDFVLRRHAEGIAEGLNRDIAETPKVPPNDILIEHLHRLQMTIRKMAATNVPEGDRDD